MTMDNCGGEEVKGRHMDCAAAAKLHSVFENAFSKSTRGNARQRLEDKPPRPPSEHIFCTLHDESLAKRTFSLTIL